jgi:hypothetical protein
MQQHAKIECHCVVMLISLYMVELSAIVIQSITEATLYSCDSKQFLFRIVHVIRRSKRITIASQIRPKRKKHN